MSAIHNEDEFGVGEDLEALLGDAAPKPRKNTKVTSGTAGTASIVTTTGPSLEEMKATLRAEILAEIAAEAAKATPEPAIVLPTPGGTIHFLEDGFTVGGKVFYRGEEYVAPDGTEWVNATGPEQVARYGKRYFREGAWSGQGYDLSDPLLTEADRARLSSLGR